MIADMLEGTDIETGLVPDFETGLVPDFPFGAATSSDRYKCRSFAIS